MTFPFPFASSLLRAFGADIYTKLLLRFDGVEGATTTVDDSLSQHVMTIEGLNCRISATPTPPFGTTSLLMPNAEGAQIGGAHTPASADFDFGIPSGTTNDFTLEAYINLAASPSSYMNFMGYHFAGWLAAIFPSGVTLWTSGTYRYFGWPASINGGVPAINTWYHIAIVRTGTTMRAFVNGVSCPNTSGEAGVVCSLGGNVMWVGGGSTSYNLYGSIKQVRVSKGIARWTTDFDAQHGHTEYGG